MLRNPRWFLVEISLIHHILTKNNNVSHNIAKNEGFDAESFMIGSVIVLQQLYIIIVFISIVQHINSIPI